MQPHRTTHRASYTPAYTRLPLRLVSKTMTPAVDSNLKLDKLEAEIDGSDNVVIPIELQQGGAAADNLVDWDGPEDPENPLNWPTHKNFGHVILVSVISLIT